jgi:hypothetical protein
VNQNKPFLSSILSQQWKVDQHIKKMHFREIYYNFTRTDKKRGKT